jgi:predicted RNase H-like HicB family nuclease
MKSYKIVVVIEKEAGADSYSAFSPTLPGCFSSGNTVQEARRNIRAAIRLHIASLVSHGSPVPREKDLVHSEVVTVRLPAVD